MNRNSITHLIDNNVRVRIKKVGRWELEKISMPLRTTLIMGAFRDFLFIDINKPLNTTIKQTVKNSNNK
jgi:hypothetical protein